MEHANSDGPVKRRLVKIGIAISFGIVALTGCAMEGSKPKPDVASISSELSAALPSGSSPSDVAQYLNAKGYNAGRPFDPETDLIDQAKMAHMGKNADHFEMRAIVRNVRRTFWVTTDIQMIFTFDRQKRLLNIEVKEGHTGP
ncbi:MAG: hypothetical protein U5J78_03220 [Parasphingorhabdus sp.]|nr:hypothetical protein [Parasphingorhabdus sp.]